MEDGHMQYSPAIRSPRPIIWPDILGFVQRGTKVIHDPSRIPSWESEAEFPERSLGCGQWFGMWIEMSYLKGTKVGPIARSHSQIHPGLGPTTWATSGHCQ
jgi:hypothetical protein